MSEADSLDPRVIDTIIAEAGNNVAGQRAVAAAIINRAKAQGKTPLQIVQQSGQFEGYSNPGSASIKAQKIASVRQNATKAFNDVLTGAVADPLKGGKDFRSDAAANGLHAPHGTVSIGGNTFALGNAPSSAVAAIDAVAPVPRSIPTSLSAYADTPAVALPPLPIPRPSNPEGIRSVEINPDGTLKQSLTDALAQRFGNSTARTGADTSIYNTVTGYTPAFQSPSPLAPFVSEDHPTSNAVMPPLPRSNPLLAPGNLNLDARKVYNAPDGSYRTENSISIGTDKGEVLIPTIVNGKQVSNEEAIKHYQQTGENLGTFATPDDADNYAQQLHLRQARFYAPSPLISDDHPRSNAVQGDALASRSVHTVQIDPLTGNPVTTPSLQDALTAKAAQMAQQRPQSVGQTSPITAPLPPLPAPKFTFGSTPSYENYPETSGAIRTPSQAGNVALPTNVVPSSVLRDLQTIAPRVANSSGSPDDRQIAPVIKPASLSPVTAPVPMPSRPSVLNTSPIVQRNSNDVVKSVPYVPPTPSPSNYTDASNPLDLNRLGLTVGPPATPAVQAITKQIVNPDYTKWVASNTQPLKAGQAYTATGNVVTQAQQNAFGGLTSVPIPPPIPVRTPAPSKYITVKVPGVTQPNVPLPRPRPATPTTNNGGLLGLLFPGTNQNAFSLMGNGISSLFGGGSSPAAPRNSAPVSMAPAPATAHFLSDRGVDSSNMTIGQQMNALQKSLEGRD